jgi:RNA polymerase sigma-70 factor (ECF subfamily)
VARVEQVVSEVPDGAVSDVAPRVEQTPSTRLALARRAAIANWVASTVMPHEQQVRRALIRWGIPADELDDVIQDAYCRLAVLNDVDHIERPDAYFYTVARSVAVRRLRQYRVVRLDAIAEIEGIADDERPSPERQAGGRRDLDRVLAIMARLPDRCRRVVQLRKIDGWSQKQIAAHLGTTEKAVEKQVWLGVRAIRKAWSRNQNAVDERIATTDRGDVRGNGR